MHREDVQSRYDDYEEGYPPDWDARRTAVLHRDGYTCQDCGIHGTRVDDVVLEVDHVTPRSEGGGHRLGNLQTLCVVCHAAKHPDNPDVAARLRETDYRDDPGILRRVARVLGSVLPVGGASRHVTDEYGRRLAITPLSAVQDTAPETAVTVEGRVAELETDTHESVHQAGYLAPVDDDGDPTTRFVVWADDLPTVHEGRAYRFVGGRTDEYRNRIEVHLDAQTSVVALER